MKREAGVGVVKTMVVGEICGGGVAVGTGEGTVLRERCEMEEGVWEGKRRGVGVGVGVRGALGAGVFGLR